MRARNCKISLQSTIKVTNNSSALCGRNDSKDNPNAITAMQDVPIMISHFLQQTYAVQR